MNAEARRARKGCEPPALARRDRERIIRAKRSEGRTAHEHHSRGAPIHDDFFSLVGRGFSSDAVLEFTTAVGVVSVPPTFLRPHLALVARLPTTLPVGAATVRLTSVSVPASNSVPATVAAGAPQAVRLLQPGEAKARPYTIVFVANPGIESGKGVGFSADPILTNRFGYHDVVNHSCRNLFAVAEDLLRHNDNDARLRLVSVFDPTRPADAANSLSYEVPSSNLMETRRAVLAAFLATFGVVADMVFVIHGSTTHTWATAWFTTDDAASQAGPQVPLRTRSAPDHIKETQQGDSCCSWHTTKQFSLRGCVSQRGSPGL